MLTIFIHQRQYWNQLPVTWCLFTIDRHASADICAASLEY